MPGRVQDHFRYRQAKVGEKPDATAEKPKIADLKEGDAVSVAYEKQGDQLRATAVLRSRGRIS